MRKLVSVVIIFGSLLNPSIFAQVGIGTNTPDSSAVLELQSSNQGFLMPRLTTLQQLQIEEPAIGLMIFNIDSLNFWYFNGLYWLTLQTAPDTIFLSHWICGTEISYEGQNYNTVRIGSQCWLKENLNAGTMISGTIEQSNNGTIEKYCYDNLESNCNIYGGLYQWDEAMQYSTQQGVQGICPPGWHIPTDSEWTAFTNYVSSVPDYQCNNNSTYIAKSLAATTNWVTSTSTCAVGNNLAANNATGFTALPGGTRLIDGSFSALGTDGFCWSSWEYSSFNAWNRTLYYKYAYVHRDIYYKTGGRSVRCLKD